MINGLGTLTIRPCPSPVDRRGKTREDAVASLDSLGHARLAALETLGQAVEFLERARVKDRDLESMFETVDMAQEDLKSWREASLHARSILAATTRGAAIGAATAAATTQLVTIFATASTGTAISTLSGAAATNAMLAWLGGGAIAAGGGGIALGAVVLNSVIAGPAVFVGGLYLEKQAEKYKTEVVRAIAEMDVQEAEMDRQLAIVAAVLRRAEEVREATVATDTSLKKLLETADISDIDEVYAVARTAKSLATLLDVRIVDNELPRAD